MQKRYLITGANGQLGRAITGKLRQTDAELILTEAGRAAEEFHLQELDITKTEAVLEFARRVKPTAILNCAAYTAVDAQEKDVDLSYRINAIGARNLAIAAQETGSKLLHVSTDYVFSGDGVRPYIEFDAPAPVSVYGKTKLAGEEFVKQFCQRSFILRTAWLYGEGKNFVKTMLALSQTHQELSVVNDQVGSPTSAEELANAICSLLDTENYGLFHATCEGDCSWAEFASEIFRLAGKDTMVHPITSQEYQQQNPQSAKRPAYSILDNYMLRLTGGYQFADWHDAIRTYMEGLKG